MGYRSSVLQAVLALLCCHVAGCGRAEPPGAAMFQVKETPSDKKGAGYPDESDEPRVGSSGSGTSGGTSGAGTSGAGASGKPWDASTNPFGLPAPRDFKRPGTVVLHGGGDVGPSDAVFHQFLARAGGKNAHIVLIPSGSLVRIEGESEEDFEDRVREAFPEFCNLVPGVDVASFTLLYTDVAVDPVEAREDGDAWVKDKNGGKPPAEDEDFVAPLDTATGVWIPGRYQGKFRYRFVRMKAKTPTLFQNKLRGVLERGGVVGGSGAGMAALPEICFMGNSEDIEGRSARPYLQWGFGLLKGIYVDQNFDDRPGRLERLTNALRDESVLKLATKRPFDGLDPAFEWPRLGIGVNADTALFITGNRVRVFGDSYAHIFWEENERATLRWKRICLPT